MAYIVLTQVIIMALLMGVGYFLFKKKILTTLGTKELGSLLVMVIIPSVIIKSLLVEYSNEKLQLLILSTIISFICFIVSITVSYFFFKNDPIANFGASFCNAGFIGLPLVQNTLGNDAVFLIVSVIVQLNILQWTVGVYNLTKDKSNVSYKKIVFNPVILSTLIGLILFLCRIQLPQTLMSTLSSLANLNTPIAMILCGSYLAQSNLFNLFSNIKLYRVSFVRLFVIPLLTLIILLIIPMDQTLRLALFIAFITPIGTNLAIFSHLFNKDIVYSVELICNSTILSILTIPLWISIYGLII